MFRYIYLTLGILAGCILLASFVNTPNSKVKSTENQVSTMENKKIETATLGGGCFWCMEAIFQRLEGVKMVRPGYSGGNSSERPTYEQISKGNTGYAEVVHIEFDPSVISYDEILLVFFKTHDPTTLNRQGNDRGTQYRSVIFYHSDSQKTSAEKMIQELTAKNVFDDPIVTEIASFNTVHYAEEYHHDYYNQNKNKPYCMAVIAPKILKFEKAFKDKLKKGK